MNKYELASRVRQNVLIGVMESQLGTGQTIYIIAALDESSRYAIAHDILFVNSTATWAAFIRQKVLTNKHIAQHPEPITFYLGCEPENIPLTIVDLPKNHRWVADDGRCADILNEFFDELIDSMLGKK